MLLTYIYIYIDIVLDVPDTSGESKNNIGPPEGGPKKMNSEMATLVRAARYRQLVHISKCKQTSRERTDDMKLTYQ